MNDAMSTTRVEGFTVGRILPEARSFHIHSAGPQPGQFDPTPRYPDGTPVKQGFSTGTNRGRPGGKIGIGIQATAKTAIIERYQAGEGLNPLAAAFSTSSQRVREILIQAGVTIRASGSQKRVEQRSKDMPRAKRELSPEDKEIICNRYQKGKSVKDLASQFHVGLPRIREVLAEGGVPTRKQGFNLMTTTEVLAPPAAVVEQVDAEPEPSQMDDPEPYAAAPDAHVIQVHELKPYHRPQAFDLGSLIQPNNVTVIARAIKGMVDEMNTIPGVTASFRFGYELTAGAR